MKKHYTILTWVKGILPSGSFDSPGSQNRPGTWSPTPSFSRVKILVHDLWTKHYRRMWNLLVVSQEEFKNLQFSTQEIWSLPPFLIFPQGTGGPVMKAEHFFFHIPMTKAPHFTSFLVTGFLLCFLMLEPRLNKLCSSQGFLLLDLFSFPVPLFHRL